MIVVATAEDVEVETETMVEGTGGGMTLKDTVAPHSAREDPLGQHPPSVQ